MSSSYLFIYDLFDNVSVVKAIWHFDGIIIITIIE
jgi:hypothetical protein